MSGRLKKKSSGKKHAAGRPQVCGGDAPEEFGGKITCPACDAETGAETLSHTGTDADSGTQKTAAQVSAHPEPHIVWNLFLSFLKIGAFTFGGGYAMVPLIQREVTDRRKWIEPERFLEMLTLAQSAPGPISLNTAVFVGYNLSGYRGAAAAILGAILPSFAIIILIAMYFTDIKDNRVVVAVFKGMRPAVVALIAAPLFGFTKGMGAYRTGLALLAAAAIWRLGISPAWFILIGAAGGIVWAYYKKRKEGGK